MPTGARGAAAKWSAASSPLKSPSHRTFKTSCARSASMEASAAGVETDPGSAKTRSTVRSKMSTVAVGAAKSSTGAHSMRSPLGASTPGNRRPGSTPGRAPGAEPSAYNGLAQASRLETAPKTSYVHRINIYRAVYIEINLMIAPSPRTPAPAPDRSNGHRAPKPEYPDNRRYDHAGPNRIVGKRRVCRPPPRSVNHHRIVAWNIHNLRVCSPDLDTLPPDHNPLLGCRSKMSCFVRSSPQPLNGVHNLDLLSQKRFPQLLSPFGFLRHHIHNLWKRGKRLDA